MRDKVLDLSQYDLPTFDAACLKAEGAQGAILGVFSRGNPPDDMAAAAAALKAAGVPVVGFYGVIYFGDAHGQVRDVSWAIELAKRYGAKRVWLDCEIDANQAGWTAAPTPTPAQRVQAIRHAVELVEHSGLLPGIYTAAWWWNPNTASSRAFAHLPLWHAQYGPNGDPRSQVTHVNYGGWSEVAVHQYTSTKVICGRGRDHNYYTLEEDFEGMASAEYEELLARIDRVEKAAVSGAEDRDIDDVQRAKNINYRLDEMAARRQNSINDRAASAIYYLKAIAAILASAGAGAGAIFGGQQIL